MIQFQENIVSIKILVLQIWSQKYISLDPGACLQTKYGTRTQLDSVGILIINSGLWWWQGIRLIRINSISAINWTVANHLKIIWESLLENWSHSILSLPTETFWISLFENYCQNSLKELGHYAGHDHHGDTPEYHVFHVEFERVEIPFIIALWIFVSSLAKIGKYEVAFNMISVCYICLQSTLSRDIFYCHLP